MPGSQGAVLSYTSSKSCFIYTSENITKHTFISENIGIFKITYDSNKSAYFSNKIDSSLSEHEILLNGRYAQSLGIKDRECILVEQIEENVFPAEKVYLEPVNFDDWEIMQLNSQTVQHNLLNQIRIIWQNQTFPVWAHNVSFFVKVASVEPNIEPVLLVDGTTILVSPKERNVSLGDTLNSDRQKQKREMLLQYKHLRKHKKQKLPDSGNSSLSSTDSILSKPEDILLPSPSQNKTNSFSLFRYFMNTVFTYGPNASQFNGETYDYNFVPLHLDFRVRVISCSKFATKNLPLASQATTVFISDKTFSANCDIFPVPDCFVAKLSKILSPLELKEKLQAMQTRDIKDKSKKKKDEKTTGSTEKNTILDSLHVKVVVLKSMKEEFEAPVSLFLNFNVIAIPLEIKRRFGLEVTSCVRLQSVENRPFFFDGIVLQPLENIHSNFGDNLATAAFTKWIEDANLEDSSLVISDGTLIKLNVSPGKTCDFIAILAQNDEFDSLISNSPSSLTSTSSSSLETENNCNVMPNVLKYGYLNNIRLPKIQIKLGNYTPQMSKYVWFHNTPSNKVDLLYQNLPSLSLEALGGVKDISERIMTDFELWFNLSPLAFSLSGYSQNHGCMLIHGPTGVGKTTLLKALCKKLIGHPYYVYISIIECLPLRGKRVETIAKKWDAILGEATHRQPSLIMFEDLDKLASASVTPEQESLPDAIYFSTVAQTFITLIEKIIDHKSGIVVVATSKSTHSLHPMLTSARGRHVFQSIWEISPPDFKARANILQCLVLSKLHISADELETNDWQNLATKTEGYVAQDLDCLVDRAMHAAFVRTNFATQNHEGNEQISLTYDDFETASENYTPSALRGLQLLQSGSKTWKDVGGLQNVKKIIEQILSWPLKYKELFQDFALRPQTNILLYGAPGTGKTLIAGVVANECGLNFISIKGPELLSKFIGASEQAVRDLFTRASGAKPCILFFDEFDALAPRRGHDSTGVTDRVVNQLLTQIDGVENLEGVYVLAATSRPELIDPALLRPGRFDKCLLCPLPNEEERQEILEALSFKLTFAEDVDFKDIVSRTQHFSGADLQALLYSAQIAALHENQANKSRGCSVSDDDGSDLPIGDSFLHMPTLREGAQELSNEASNEIFLELNMLFNNLKIKNERRHSSRPRRHSTISLTIEQKHILNVLSTMSPSVSPEERLRYEMIFQKFRNSGSEFSSPDKSNAKRVTFA